jgi:large subunit ribosomal protein L9
MATELILIEDVADLGKIGDRVRVADGYARNFLLPRKLAAKVNTGILRALEAKKLRLQQEHEERLNVARSLAEKLARLSLTLRVQAGEDDKLYGSVHIPQVLEALEKEGIQLEKSAVIMPEHIRALGYYTIDIRLHSEVQAALKISVERA